MSNFSPISIGAVFTLFVGTILDLNDVWYGFSLVVLGIALGIFGLGVAVGSWATDTEQPIRKKAIRQ